MASEPGPTGRRVLVVGATGILRPAALRLLAAGHTVVAVARGRVRLTALEAEGGHRVEVVPLDVRRPDPVTLGPDGALGRPVDAAVVYAPRPPAAEFDRLLGRTAGPVVRIRTSAAADPRDTDGEEPLTWPWATTPREAGESRLLLGWTGPADAPRWHTPEEVSGAALDVLDRGGDAVLGRVRPWGDRP